MLRIVFLGKGRRNVNEVKWEIVNIVALWVRDHVVAARDYCCLTLKSPLCRAGEWTTVLGQM
jgi:hypothetical protein